MFEELKVNGTILPRPDDALSLKNENLDGTVPGMGGCRYCHGVLLLPVRE